jgi:biotin carboxylase
MTDKAAMRRRLDEKGIPQPPSILVHGARELEAALATIGLPAVVKPADSGGQRGVFKVDTSDAAAKALEAAIGVSRTGRALVERFMDGIELNGIVVVRSGRPDVLTLSDRLRPAGAGFAVGWAHRFPSTLPADTLTEAAKVAADAVVALGLRDGIGFPQLIADVRSGVGVVEVAARIPAGQMADLVRHATGIELFDIAIALALGHEVPDEAVTPTLRRPVAIRFLTAAPGLLPAGTVRAIGGLNDVRNATGVLDAGLYFSVGEQLRPVQVDADRRGYIVATGRSGDEALRLADTAAAHLTVDVELS